MKNKQGKESIANVFYDLLKVCKDEETKQNINDIAKTYGIDLCTKPIYLKDLECGKTFRYKGYEFTKLANEENSCYCLLNDSVFESEFGETNDWAQSPIRGRLNEFDENGNSKVLPNINENDLVEVSLNYYAYKIPNGRTKDKITLMSYEEWYTYYIINGFDIVGDSSWLRSGYSNGANVAYYLGAGGSNYSYTYVTNEYAVRPALHLKPDILVEI